MTQQRNLDARIRQLAVIEVRLAKVSTSVANMGGIVRAVGYVTMALGVAIGLSVMLVNSGSSTPSLAGVGFSIILAGLGWGIPLVLVGGYAQMRSLSVQADALRRDVGDFEMTDSADSSVPARTQSVGVRPERANDTSVQPPAQASPTPGTGQSAWERVRGLSDSEKARLATQPPSDLAPAWWPDPLQQSSQRYWNGTQWTGRLRG